jgi:poly(hydroxyalkanoate) depolymerase family esterase
MLHRSKGVSMSLHNLTNKIDRALSAAGLNTRTGPANAVVKTIREALNSARIAQDPSDTAAPSDADRPDTIDVQARDVDEQPVFEPTEQPPVGDGQFLSLRSSGPFGGMAYKLYVPGSHRSHSPMPLVVMLHGCKQNPYDFAKGTRMNEVAEEQGFLVAYPAQPSKANGSNCWNWFEPQHQARGGIEPSLIVGIVREVCSAYAVDEGSVFVAGLSAGAAMAVILGDTYPEVFAAVAAHSGLPQGAAHDVPSAFAVMHGAAPATASMRPPARQFDASHAVRTVVFHGDADATVVPKNGTAIVQQAVSKLAADRGLLTREVEHRLVNGRHCTRTTHRDRSGHPVVEHWTVHGAGHAWFGGSSAGSFTESQGPDASREMMRFFMAPVSRESAPPAVTAG